MNLKIVIAMMTLVSGAAQAAEFTRGEYSLVKCEQTCKVVNTAGPAIDSSNICNRPVKHYSIAVKGGKIWTQYEPNEVLESIKIFEKAIEEGNDIGEGLIYHTLGVVHPFKYITNITTKSTLKTIVKAPRQQSIDEVLIQDDGSLLTRTNLVILQSKHSDDKILDIKLSRVCHYARK